MERVCFRARIRPDRLTEYRQRHQQVWPEMRAALREAGWRNYSLFLSDDGLLIGYLETDDFDAAQRRMAATEVNRRWQADMAPYFAGLGDQRPDEGFTGLAEVFHLDLSVRLVWLWCLWRVVPGVVSRAGAAWRGCLRPGGRPGGAEHECRAAIRARPRELTAWR